MLRRPIIAIAALLAIVVGALSSAALHTSAGSRAQEHEIEQIVYLGATACGVERWAIKTGIDRGAGLVNVGLVIHTSISRLRSLVPPVVLPPKRRIKPTESTVFRLTATLRRYKIESDSDIHLVLADKRGRTMIAEIPAPECVGTQSPFLLRIGAVRRGFVARFHPTDNWIRTNARLTLTGIGFFDVPHGQAGVAPNAIELHPLLKIRYGTGSPAPTVIPTPIPATPGGVVLVTATVDNPMPLPKTNVTVMGHISVSGAGVAGVPMDATWHYKSKDVTCAGQTNAAGDATCSRNIGTATRGFTVKIDVRFTYHGYAYTVTTGVTPA